MNYDLKSLMQNDGFVCPSCGRTHTGLLKDCFIGEGVMAELPGLVKKYGGSKPFVLCDTLTYEVAGEWVCRLLEEAGIPCTLHVIQRVKPSPDERIVGEAMMYCPLDCDLVIAVGSGVINDTGKILASAKNVPNIIVATAPSMDGFASATSSMERSGLKVSLNSKCPDAVIGEAEILAKAPVHMIRSGIGDMLAKYVSIAEWQIPYAAAAAKHGWLKGSMSENGLMANLGRKITRQDAMVLIHRAFFEGEEAENSMSFDDEQKISSYAYDAVECLTEMNIVSGYEDNTVKPLDYVKREQVAKMLWYCIIIAD